jgi:hypothetical protein
VEWEPSYVIEAARSPRATIKAGTPEIDAQEGRRTSRSEDGRHRDLTVETDRGARVDPGVTGPVAASACGRPYRVRGVRRHGIYWPSGVPGDGNCDFVDDLGGEDGRG